MEVFNDGQLQQTVEAPNRQKHEQEGSDRPFRDLHHLDGKALQRTEYPDRCALQDLQSSELRLQGHHGVHPRLNIEKA
ncbi:MAG: hypothetical protein BWY97_01369 [Tenericutes bacterium ADurb.BinA124]|nr:MAG: hypothetical protein BWY97_01369 [Tenericutes bacterium ADurb.BinA124]